MNTTTLTQPHFRERAHQLDSARLGMWAFISSEVLFFSPLLMSYIVLRLTYYDGVAAASQHTDFIAGTVNTAVLLTSSLLMALANHAAQEGLARQTTYLLRAGAMLGMIFLAIKFYEYYDDWRTHLVPGVSFLFAPEHKHAAELFFYLYFCLTGLHALHLLVGICIVLLIAQRTAHNLSASQHAVEITALYWHFVDVMWVFLYPMLYLVHRYG